MKSCDDYGVNIQLYLDKELTGQDLEEFRAHLKECVACQQELEAEEALAQLLYRSRPLYSAPDSLRDRVRQVTHGVAASADPAPVQVSNRVTGIGGRSFRRNDSNTHRWQALVAAVLIICIGLVFLPAAFQRSRAANYVETAVTTHRGFMDGSLPLEVQSDSPTTVSAWFIGKVPFNFRLPVSHEISGQEVPYKLMGGRLVSYKNSYAALVAYRMQKENISLLVTSDKFASAAGGEEVRSGGLVFHYSRQANFNVVTWSNHGLTYALVSSLPGSGKHPCLVCHQNMADSQQFASE